MIIALPFQYLVTVLKARISLACYLQADILLSDDPLSAVDAHDSKSIDNCLLE